MTLADKIWTVSAQTEVKLRYVYIYIDIFASVGATSKMCKIDECADATGYAGGKAIKSGVSDICRCLDNLSAGKTGFIISALSQHRHPCTGTHTLRCAPLFCKKS